MKHLGKLVLVGSLWEALNFSGAYLGRGYIRNGTVGCFHCNLVGGLTEGELLEDVRENLRMLREVDAQPPIVVVYLTDNNDLYTEKFLNNADLLRWTEGVGANFRAQIVYPNGSIEART